jgi:hypothetical protein
MRFTLHHCQSARSFRALWTLEEMGLLKDTKLITMPFPPRVFYRKYVKEINGTIP